MGISVDLHKMEKLTQLESVLELLQNPESYTRMISDAKAVVAQYKEVSARYNSVEAADRFLGEAKELLVSRLLSIHNLRFLIKQTRIMREAIKNGDFAAKKKAFDEAYFRHNPRPARD
mgnify:CR=1 FL=1